MLLKRNITAGEGSASTIVPLRAFSLTPSSSLTSSLCSNSTLSIPPKKQSLLLDQGTSYASGQETVEKISNPGDFGSKSVLEVQTQSIPKPDRGLWWPEKNRDGRRVPRLPEKEGDENDNGEYEDETDDDKEEDGDGACAFRFEGEMDPLAFPEDDTFGVQPYQQFELLEHEYGALAERKRNSLSHHHHHLLPPRESPVNKSRQEGFNAANMEEIMEVMNYGRRKKSRKQDYAYISAYNVGILGITHLSEASSSFKQSRKRGRRKGSKNKLNPEVTRKLGDATLHYAHGRYEEAICVLKEVIRVAPNLSDPYHTLGLIYCKIGDKKRALNFYVLAAHLTPKDSSLWKLLVTWSINSQKLLNMVCLFFFVMRARKCCSGKVLPLKAITADPADMSLRFSRASLYVELGEYQKAAESYEQISRLCPENVEALKTATMVVTSVLLAYSVNYLLDPASLNIVVLPQNGLIIISQIAALCFV
ncbi:hypothetical protein RHMOL_Rhmol02G0283400 [Rhododendron molle]|uniref:Uncharacterized protein n=1 Tax=Rhododendron molle TaxID=49168 RepID=A0ACC0PWE9_RHOML|nr:hypothetical protein RHMOL_Rhmol02G0283400 [Rhododendron molle]